jgi:hypothetical protein
VCDVKRKLQVCHEIARDNLKRTKQRRVAQQMPKVNLPHLQIGDKVLLWNEKASKLQSPLLGPYSITEIDANGLNVELALTKHKRTKVHINRLKNYRTKERENTK